MVIKFKRIMRILDRIGRAKIWLPMVLIPVNIFFPEVSTECANSRVGYDEMVEQVINDRAADRVRDTVTCILSDFGGSGARVGELSNETIAVMEYSRVLNGLPVDVFYRLIYKESSLDSTSLSCAGASGYMQITRNAYEEARCNSVVPIRGYGDMTTSDNIMAGATYIRLMHEKVRKKYRGASEIEIWSLVLSSYNAGFSIAGVALYDYKETRYYVSKIMSRVEV